MEKSFKVSEIQVAAFLTLSGFNFSFERKGTKVFFCFTSSPELYEKMQAFNTGAQVDVAEYSRELRRLRALMYEEKGRG